MRRVHKAGIIVILAGLLVISGKQLSKSIPTSSSSSVATISAQPTSCDASLWSHVYHPARLIRLVPDCLTVTGIIDFIRKEADGDDHIGLKLDSGQEQYLTDGNINFEKGDLVLEPVCELPVTQADAVDVCVNYHSTIVVPPVGTHVTVTGSYVADTIHKPVHHEIHPITSLQITSLLPSETGK